MLKIFSYLVDIWRSWSSTGHAFVFLAVELAVLLVFFSCAVVVGVAHEFAADRHARFAPEAVGVTLVLPVWTIFLAIASPVLESVRTLQVLMASGVVSLRHYLTLGICFASSASEQLMQPLSPQFGSQPASSSPSSQDLYPSQTRLRSRKVPSLHLKQCGSSSSSPLGQLGTPSQVNRCSSTTRQSPGRH